MWPVSQRTPWLFWSSCGGGSSCRWDGSLSSCSRPGSWQAGGSAYFASGFTDPEDDLRAHRAGPPPLVIGLEYGPVGAPGTSRVAKQLPARLAVRGRTMKTLVIGLGTLVLVALTRPALAQRCLSFRAPAFFAGAVVAPGYPYPAYGYPAYPYYPYPLPPAPSLGFGRGGIYGHVFVGRDEGLTSYTFPGRDSWQ